MSRIAALPIKHLRISVQRAPKPSMPNDLVQRLHETWEDIEQSLTAYLRKHQVSDPDVLDIINETYRRIRSRNLPADIDELEGYAITVAKNVLKRRLKLRARFVDLDDPDLIDESLASDIDAHHSLEHAYDSAREIDAALQEFDQLPEHERFSINAHLNDESTKAIAAQVGRSPRQVQRYIEKGIGLISRATKRLRGERDEE